MFWSFDYQHINVHPYKEGINPSRMVEDIWKMLRLRSQHAGGGGWNHAPILSSCIRKYLNNVHLSILSGKWVIHVRLGKYKHIIHSEHFLFFRIFLWNHYKSFQPKQNTSVFLGSSAPAATLDICHALQVLQGYSYRQVSTYEFSKRSLQESFSSNTLTTIKPKKKNQKHILTNK